MMEGPGADSEEKHEPASDIDTAWMDSLKVLDPEGPIREADIAQLRCRLRSHRLLRGCQAHRQAPRLQGSPLR